MHKDKYAKKAQGSFGRILYWTVGTLFMLTLLSIWLVSGLFAKYTTSGNDADSARVAKGLPAVTVLEHKADDTNKTGVYTLLDDKAHQTESDKYQEVPGNTYEKVIPGVDIPKDPFVRLDGVTEVDFKLYIKVEVKNIPYRGDNPLIYYRLTDAWQRDESRTKEVWNDGKTLLQSGTYVYQYTGTIGANNGYFDAGTYTKANTDIPILEKIATDPDTKKKYEVQVSQYYDPSKMSGFEFTFTAWLEQVD